MYLIFGTGSVDKLEKFGKRLRGRHHVVKMEAPVTL